MDGYKTLSLSCGLESTHLSFPHPSGLMRNLGAIVGVLLDVVADLRQHDSLRCTVALEFVGNDSERLLALDPHQSAKESLGGALIAARL
jgi:hypothetical protein